MDYRILRQDTFLKFKALLDNYDRDTGQREYESREEREEIDAFLDAIMATDVMRELYDFLNLKRNLYVIYKCHEYETICFVKLSSWSPFSVVRYHVKIHI